MNAVAQFQPPRLPYHPVMQERFGVDASGWKALVEAVYPLAKTPDSVAMALSYCKARKLDPFKKPVHIVPMWDSKVNGYVETIWPGISEVRTTAFRTGQYAGCDEAEFGPMMSKSFTGKVKRKEGYVEQTVEVEFPEWCRMTVYRVLGDRVCKFVGPKVKWLESYATIGNTDLPNDMWQSRPEGQIEKCAEASALRKAFPEELGNELTAEEMAGRRVEGGFSGPETAEPARRQPPAPPKIEDAVVMEMKPSARAPKPPAHDPDTGEIDQVKPEPTKVTSGKAAEPKEQDKPDYDPEPIIAEIQAIMDACHDDDALEACRRPRIVPLYDKLQPAEHERVKEMYAAAKTRIADAMEAAERAENERAAAEAGDPVGPDERGHPDDDTFPGDLPSKSAAKKKPEKMTPAEFEAHCRAYIEAATDAEKLKKRWYMDEELREPLDAKVKAELRTLWKARMEALRAAEGQG